MRPGGATVCLWDVVVNAISLVLVFRGEAFTHWSGEGRHICNSRHRHTTLLALGFSHLISLSHLSILVHDCISSPSWPSARWFPHLSLELLKVSFNQKGVFLALCVCKTPRDDLYCNRCYKSMKCYNQRLVLSLSLFSQLWHFHAGEKRSTHKKQISQQVEVFTIYVVDQENSEEGCQPGESEPINSTVPSLQKSTALKRCRKRTRHKNSSCGGQLFMLPPVKCCQQRNCGTAAEGFVGRICCPGILSTTATSAIIKAQLADWVFDLAWIKRWRTELSSRASRKLGLPCRESERR